MTITHPNRTNLLLGRITLLLAGLLFLSAVWLIFAYNKMVNYKHGLTDLNSRLKNVEAQNSELKNSIFALTQGEEWTSFAASHNLILDKTPKYLSVNPQWFLALQ